MAASFVPLALAPLKFFEAKTISFLSMWLPAQTPALVKVLNTFLLNE